MADQFTSTATVGDGSVYSGIPTNILKVHTNDLLFEAMPVMRYDQFATVRNDLQAQPGDTITINKYGNLTLGGAIDEDDDIEAQALSKTAVNIVVTEYANAVGLTAKYLTLAFMDEMATAAVLLGRDYARVTDNMLRDALFAGTQKLFAGDNAEQKDIASDDTLGTNDVDAAVEVLSTGNVMKFVDANGEYYVGILHPHCSRPLKKDMISLRQYAYPELIFKGEIGEYNGVRFIETGNTPNGAVANTDPAYKATLVAGYEYSTGKTNAVDLYETAIFGARSYGWATALPVELREDPGQSNFGRKVRIAYYCIQGAGIINNENIVIIRSA